MSTANACVLIDRLETKFSFAELYKFVEGYRICQKRGENEMSLTQVVCSVYAVNVIFSLMYYPLHYLSV